VTTSRHPSKKGRTVAVVGGGALLLWLLLRGKGWGLGGKGDGSGSGAGSASPRTSISDAGPRRCMVRIAASGIAVDGKPATVEEAVTACKSVEDAEVLVTGGARQGDWEDLEAAFKQAGIRMLWVVRKNPGAAAAGRPAATPATSAPCQLRLTAAGLTADGHPLDIPSAVARCKVAGRAEVSIAADAPGAIYARLARALAEVGVISIPHRNGRLHPSASSAARRER
jgi:hypothetical protein